MSEKQIDKKHPKTSTMKIFFLKWKKTKKILGCNGCKILVIFINTIFKKVEKGWTNRRLVWK